LGPGAFETITGEVVKAILLITSRRNPKVVKPEYMQSKMIYGIDVSGINSPKDKGTALIGFEIKDIEQKKQLENPDTRIIFDNIDSKKLFNKKADSYQGISPADFPRFSRYFWEDHSEGDWKYWQSTVTGHIHYGGRELIFWMDEVEKKADEEGTAYIRGE
jgi:hypothetical protein